MRPGDVFAARFTLLAPAGEGGMGVVWRAEDAVTGGDVALKVVRRSSEIPVDRFVREAKVLRGLDHPGIVRHVADGFLDDGTPWLAMEWLEGQDLAAHLEHGPLPTSIALEMARGIAQALLHTHERGFVHRDLKPSNVWLVAGDPRRVKLLDFGVVRGGLQDTTRGSTRAGALLGTPGYIAPEQARGEADLDGRADVFSLGCVLYACLAGRPPFVASHALALLAKVIMEEPPALGTLVTVEPALEELVTRMLAKAPHARPDGMREVLERLAELLENDRLPATRRAPARSPALSREQGWVCALLVDGGERGLPRTGPANTLAVEFAAVAQVAMYGGARIEAIAGGRHVLVWQVVGAPSELARMAARAALVLRDVMPGVGMALACGRASLGGGIPVGDALDRAAAHVRVSEGVAVDEGFARLVEDAFEVASVGSAHTLLRERAGRRGARTVLGRITPFVGREVELATLSLTLTEVIEESSAASVLVTGELGVGKSRVSAEWLLSLRGTHPEVQVWSAHGDPLHEGASLGVAAQLVRSACGVGLAATREEIRRQVSEQVGHLVPQDDVPRIASRLCELCGAPWQDDADDALRHARTDPVIMGDQLRAAWEDFLVAGCAVHPVLLVVDDVQWADRSSLELVDRALRNFRGKPWMVVGLGRPEHRERHPRLWADRGVREVAVAPLKDRAASRLVRAALADVAKARLERLVERAAGNPYLLEELLRAESDGQGDAIPETVLAIVEGRLARLDPESRRVLRAASVFGVHFDPRGVAAVLEGTGKAADLELLVKTEWLVALERGGYAFRHATVREAAYATLVDEDRRLAEFRAAEWLEASGESDAAAVAEHFARSTSPERAASWWVLAAERALEANDHRACVRRTDAAADCGARGPLLVRGLFAKAEAHSWLGEVRPMLETAEIAILEAAGDPSLEAEALGHATVASVRLGDIATVRRLAETVLALLGRHGHLDPVVTAATRMTRVVLHGGLTDLAERLGAAVEAVEPPIRSRSARVLAEFALWQGHRAHFAHDVESYARGMREAAQRFAAVGDRRRAVQMQGGSGHALLLLGANAESASALEEAIATATRLGLVTLVADLRQNLGLALLNLGRATEAEELERASLESFVAGANHYMACISGVYLSRILLATGRIDDALVEAEAARDRVPPEYPWALLARVAMADALLARGRDGDAESALENARAAMGALRERAEKFEEPGPVRRVFVDALVAAGLAAEAEQERREARGWLLERAAAIASEHYRRTFLEDEPDNARLLRDA